MTHWYLLAGPAAAGMVGLLAGCAIARLTGCGQCKAVRDQELALLSTMLDRELQPLVRHRLRRHRPHTCAETLDLLDVNGALLTPERWSQLEDQRETWAYRRLSRGRAITAGPDRVGADAS